MFTSKFGSLYKQVVGEGIAVCRYGRWSDSEALRVRGLYAFAADCLDVFEQHALAQGIRLTCRLHLAAPTRNDTGLCLRLVHQTEVETLGLPQHSLVDDDHRQRCHQLPVAMLAEGRYTVRRDSALVQRYLALPADRAADYRALVHTLASNISDRLAYAYLEHTQREELVIA